MSIFNPQNPGESQNFLNWSKAATAPEADKSAGILLSTLGEGIAEGADLADKTVKGIIKDDLYSKIDPIRDRFTAQLDTINQATAPSSKF